MSMLAAAVLAFTRQDPGVAVAKQYFAEAAVAARADDGQLWGKTLLASMLLIDDSTRRVYGNRADEEGKLKEEDGVWVGDLPPNLPVANYAFKWSGVRWTIIAKSTVKGSLSERESLFMHEAFHWIQPDIGLSIASAPCVHLDTLDGRIWVRLEGRAMERALTDSVGRPKHLAAALTFRAYRQSLFKEAPERERLLELNEGLAQYTGISLMGMPRQETIAYAARVLGRWPASRPSLSRWYAYDLTPAYGLLLDEMKPEWRKSISSATNIENTIASATGWSAPRDPKSRALSYAEAYGYKEIARDEVARDQEHQKVLAQLKTDLVTGNVVSLPLPSKKPFAFRTDKLVELPPYGTVFSGIRLEDDWGVLTVDTGKVLLSPDLAKAFVKRSTEGQLNGAGWSLELHEGWKLTAGPRAGDLQVSKG